MNAYKVLSLAKTINTNQIELPISGEKITKTSFLPNLTMKKIPVW